MNLLHSMIWTLGAILPLGILLALLPWLARIGSQRVRALVTSALALLFGLPLAATAVASLWLFLDAGLEQGPWLGAGLAFLAQAGGSIWLCTHTDQALRWPRAPWLLAVPLLWVLLWTALVNLDLGTQNSGLTMQLEAGRIAFRETPPPVDPLLNAAAEYEAVRAALDDGHGKLVLRPEWLKPKAEMAPWAESARGVLAQHGPALERLRDATARPQCRYESGDEHERFSSSRLMPLADLGRVLILSGRLRTLAGDPRGALDDLRCVLSMADHADETPTLLAAMLGTSLRSQVLEELPQVLSTPGITAADLERIRFDPRRDPRETVQRALRMEEAFFLDSMGRAKSMSGLHFALLADTPGPWLERPGVYAALRFAFEAQVGGYRRALGDLREAAVLDPAALAKRLDETPPVRERYRHGVLAGLFAPELDRILKAGLRGAVQRDLARAAVAAAQYHLAHGGYPTRAADLGPLPPGIRWTGDALHAEFAAEEALFRQDPPRLRLGSGH